jgi:ribose transport system permease protein
MSVPQGTTPAELDAAASGPFRRELNSLRQAGKRLGPYAPLLSLIVLSLLFALLSPRFFSLRNFVGIANEAAPILVLGMGLTFVIILGSIDLSVEGVLALSGVIIAQLVRNDFNRNNYGWLGVLAAVLIAGAMGFLNGLIHTRLRIPSFMATLAMQYVGLGLATVLLGGNFVQINDRQIRGLALNQFPDISQAPDFGLPYVTWIAIICFVVAFVIQRYTKIGRYMYAIGGGEDLAVLSGVRVNRYKVIIFTLAGLFSGIVGLIQVARVSIGSAGLGGGMLFTSITAVVVGGTALSGGEGGVLNTLVGVLIVTVLHNGMILLGVNPYIQQAIQGLIIVVAVALTINRARLKIIK